MKHDKEESVERLRTWSVPREWPINAGGTSYRWSTERGQWLKISDGAGPEAVTPVQDGDRLVCFQPCIPERHPRHRFQPGDEIWIEKVKTDEVVCVPIGGVLAIGMSLAQVDACWRRPPEKTPYSPPTLTELTAADVGRKFFADIHNKARLLNASVLLAEDGRKLVTLHTSDIPDPARIDGLTELLGGPITIVTGSDAPPRDPPERMTQLAETFPSLRGNRIAGVRPWEPELLMRAGGLSHGEICSVRFVLWVWDPQKTDWPCGPFDLGDAIGVWDETHRKAFTTWANKPWWP